MPPKQKVWSTESEFKLIHEVRSRPLLWDVSLPEYRRNDLKDVHWDEIASLLGSDFTGPIVKKRYLNMRDTFMDNHRKVKESKRSGTGSDDVYKPKWPLYDVLSFLIKTAQQSDSISTMDSQCTQSTSTASPLTNMYYDDNVQQFMIIPSDTEQAISSYPTPVGGGSSSGINSCESSAESMQQHPSPDNSVNLFSSPLSPQMFEVRRPSSAPSSVSDISQESMFLKRGIKRGKSTASEEAVQLVKKIASEPVQIPNEDAADKFGAFVASKLREMEPTKRNSVEAKIVQALYEQ